MSCSCLKFSKFSLFSPKLLILGLFKNIGSIHFTPIIFLINERQSLTITMKKISSLYHAQFLFYHVAYNNETTVGRNTQQVASKKYPFKKTLLQLVMCFASKTVNRAVSSVLIMCSMHCSSHKKIYKINNLVQQLRSFTIIIHFELCERQTR